MQIITKSVNRITWSQLKIDAISGNLDRVFHSGDKIPFRLKNDQEAAVIATKDQSGKWFFVFEDCLPDTRQYNRRDTTEGGWRNSYIRSWLNELAFTLLPDELQQLIVPTEIVQLIGDERIVTHDKLFLLSYTQVFGEGRLTAQDPEDSLLDCFKTYKDRIALRNQQAESWWLRSVGSATRACLVYSDGYAAGSGASGSFGVRPAFRFDR